MLAAQCRRCMTKKQDKKTSHMKEQQAYLTFLLCYKKSSTFTNYLHQVRVKVSHSKAMINPLQCLGKERVSEQCSLLGMKTELSRAQQICDYLTEVFTSVGQSLHDYLHLLAFLCLIAVTQALKLATQSDSFEANTASLKPYLSVLSAPLLCWKIFPHISWHGP